MRCITFSCMQILYNLAIRIYGLFIRFASVCNAKAKLWVKGRENWYCKLSQNLTYNTKPVVWFHCSSLGEFEQGRPVIEELAASANVFILLTFFSPSGYEIRKNYKFANCVSYLPLDTPRNARQFTALVKPVVAIFVKYDFWYNYIGWLAKTGTKTWLISALFYPQQLFFKRKWFRLQLANFDHFFVQNKQSKELLNNIGYKNVTLAGDTRFDRVLQIAAQAKPIDAAERFKNGVFTVIAGSSWAPEETLLAKHINSSSLDIKYIIVPHEIGEKHIEDILLKIKKKTIRYSQISKDINLGEFKVLIIDNIGMLSSLYQYANLAIIGGGFGKGIHNVLEPSVFGLPVIIGPNYSKFNEAVELLTLGGILAVYNEEMLKNTIESLYKETDKIKHIANIQREYIQTNSGATQIIVERLMKLAINGCSFSPTSIT